MSDITVPGLRKAPLGVVFMAVGHTEKRRDPIWAQAVDVGSVTRQGSRRAG
jgi:hypothetical protein